MAGKPRYPRVNSNKGNPWTKAIAFSLASLVIFFLLFKFGLSTLINFSLFLESFGVPPEELTPQAANPANSMPPILFPPPAATNSAQLDVKGIARPSQPLRLYRNDSRIGDLLANRSGEFNFNKISLELGENTLYAAVVNEAGEETAYSDEHTIFFLNKPPLLEISEPTTGFTYRAQEKQILIKGKVETDVLVTINNHLVVVQPSGRFSYLYELFEGENHLVIVAKDLAGNQTEERLTLYYQP